MPREFSRPQRVAAQIQKELAQLIQFEVKDPRIGLVTVSAVEVSRDLSHAKVFITLMERDRSVEDALKGLNSASGYMRRELGKRMMMRSVPNLHFVYDASAERGANLSALIDAAIASDSHSEK